MSGHDDLWDAARDDAERRGAAYEVPVERVRARVRRRRAARAGATGTLALATVGAVVVAVPQLLGAPGGTAVGSSGDWPAAFARCGQPVDDVVAPPGRVEQTLLQARDVVGPDRTWLGTTSTRVDGAAALPDAFDDVEVVLVRDGVVVGVDGGDGRVVVGADEVTVDPGSGTVTAVTASWGYGARLVSCDQYPDGEGDPEVAAGDYEVVMTQTVTWAEPDGSTATGRASVTAPVRVSDDAAHGQDSPETCGAPASDLAATAGPEANPFAVTLDADVPSTSAPGSPLRFTVTATNEGTAAVTGTTGHLGVLLTRDGRVVGTPAPREDVALDASLPAGASRTFEAASDLRGCAASDAGADAGPLPPGEYEVWVTADLVLTTPRGADGRATREHLVYGPWPLRLG